MLNDPVKHPLPEGWVWTKLGKLHKEVRESTNPAKYPEQFFELYSVPSFAEKMPEIVRGKEIGSSKQVVRPGEVLVCKINPRINRAWVVGNHSGNSKIASTEWIVFDEKEGLESRFLCYFLQTDAVRDYLAANVSGVGGSLMRARVAAIEDYPFPLPPLPEQERIVARLEELLSDLEAGVVRLERVRVDVKRYKASVLKAIFEGRPEQEWRRLGDVTRVLRGASPRPMGNPKYFGGTIPWIRIADITKEKGKYLTTTIDTVTREGMKKSRFLTHGSLILSICATVCVPKILSIDGCIHDGFVYFPDLPDDVDTSYMYFFFESIRSKVIQENRQGMTQVNLNTGIVSDFRVPFPPLEEQQRIVREVERRLEAAREVESAVEAGLKRAERLRQAVLRAAFEGRLL